MLTSSRFLLAASLLVAGPPLAAQNSGAFEGLIHTSEGNAQLQFGGDSLVVSNIGSSGLDGVAIELGESESHVIEFDVPPAPPGAEMRITTRGVLNGVPGQDIWTIVSRNLGETNGILLDTSIVQSGKLRVEALLDGESQAQVVWEPVPMFPPIIIIEIPDEGCWVNPFEPVAPTTAGGFAMVTGPECWARFRLPTPGPVTLTAGPTVIADEIILASSQQGSVVGSLSHTVMRAFGYPSFELFEESLGMFGNQHAAEGAAMVLGDGGTLNVANIGSSGLDGVCIDLASEPDGFAAVLSPIALRGPGSAVRLEARGNLVGAPDTNLGLCRLVRAGGGIEMTADYAGLGATFAQVAVYDDSAYVGETVVPTGAPLGTVLPGPLGEGEIVGCGKLPPAPPCFVWDWDRPVVFSAADGTLLLGDEIRVLAAESFNLAEVLDVTEFGVFGRSIAAFSLLDEDDVATPMPFEDLGCALAGAAGAPALTGDGPMEPATVNLLQLSGAAASSPAMMFVSVTESAVPFKGGTLKTVPVFLSFSLGTDASGGFALPFMLPAAAPGGLDLFFQVAVLDAGAPVGVALSNALRAQVQ